uniref:holo-[acyl-carrier-protein] synthase n=1 Tax=Davidia involucrata TaxID=16924 RepID=A0A5B7AJU2_DAVIN
MELQKVVRRWLVDISQWNPFPHDFSFAMSFLPQQDHSSITRFVKMEDRKRALVSRLLQYALVHEVLGIPFDEIIIKRTAEGKPYLECDKVNWGFPNFNFNVSHHGDYVAIASEPICLVGLDIVSHFIPEKETVPEFIQNFSSYFSSLEWDKIINAGTCDEMLNEFYRYWCLKEAFVKAIGTGVGYRLDSVEFHHTSWTNLFVKVDGKELKDWRFWLFELGKRHSVSVARGHPRNATESYKKTLRQTQFGEEEYHLGLHLPNVSFVLRTVEELIPISSRAGGIPIDVERKCNTYT